MQYRTKAIVLKTKKLGESDQILHLYSEDRGPLHAVAKSARKLNNSFGSKAQSLSCSEYLIGEGKNLDIISQAKLINDFRNIKSDYESLNLAYFILDSFEQISVNDSNYQEPFRLLYDSLTKMDSNKSLHENLILSLKYLWDLIEMHGYKPDLHSCALSHKSRAQNSIPSYFDFESGAITSISAYEDFIKVNPYQDWIRNLNPEVFKFILALESKNLEASLNENSMDKTEELLYESIRFLAKHLEFRIHKEFKSLDLIRLQR